MKKYLPLIIFALAALSPGSVSAQTVYSQYFGRAEASYYTVYNAFKDSLLNYGIRPRLNAKTWFNLKGTSATDTLQTWRRSAGNTMAFIDTSGHMTLSSVKADSFRMGSDTSLYRKSTNTIASNDTITGVFASLNPVLFGPPLADFTQVYTDSVTSAAVGADTTGTRTVWWKYFSWTTANSPSLKTGIYTCTYIPTGTFNPDSLLMRAWFDGTAATSDSGAIMVVVKNKDGTIISTGWKTVATASTWEHIPTVISNEFTRNKEYSITVYTKAVSGKRWCWTAPRFQ